MNRYVWGRRNPWVRLNFFGVLTFTAPYLVWFFILMDYIMSGGKYIVSIYCFFYIYKIVSVQPYLM